MKIESCYFNLVLQIEKEINSNLIDDDQKIIAVARELVTRADYFWLPKGNPHYANRSLLKYICETRNQKT